MSGASLVRVRYALPGQEPRFLDQELLTYSAPYDLAAQSVGGILVPDSPFARHMGDRRAGSAAYTLTGELHARSPEELEAVYFRVKRALHFADQVWRGGRYLKLSYALLGGADPLPGECVVPAPIVCAVRDRRWYRLAGQREMALE